MTRKRMPIIQRTNSHQAQVCSSKYEVTIEQNSKIDADIALTWGAGGQTPSNI